MALAQTFSARKSRSIAIEMALRSFAFVHGSLSVFTA